MDFAAWWPGCLPSRSRRSRTRLQIGTVSLLTRPLHLAVRRTHPQAKSIVDRFNAQIRAMVADRTYHRLLHVDWIRADVDGDGLEEYVPKYKNYDPLRPEPGIATVPIYQFTW
jgi:hypothetical protein